jgi:NADH:ubiquinone oxidoreductase subunit 6 (subunit J)
MADSAAFIAVAQPGSENGFSSVFNTPIIVFIGAIVFYFVTLAKAFRSRTTRAKVGWSIGAVFLALICLLSIVAWLYRGSSALDERVASAINALAKRFNSEPARETVQRTSPADTSKTTTPDQNA